MNRSTHKPDAGQSISLVRRLKISNPVLGLLVAGLALAIQAQVQSPRQMQFDLERSAQRPRLPVQSRAPMRTNSTISTITMPQPQSVGPAPHPAIMPSIANAPSPPPTPLQPSRVVSNPGTPLSPPQTSSPAPLNNLKPRMVMPYLPYDQSDNVFMISPNLPSDLKRVAVLPLASERTAFDRGQGCEMLGSILLSELGKTCKFEVVAIQPETLRSLTGQSSWTGVEALPADFFDALQRASGCDAVLFCELTAYRAQAPLAVGWRMKLVDARTHQILWAVDKEYDADQRATLKDAHRYEAASQPLGIWPFSAFFGTKDAWLMDISPRRFGQYAIARAVATLPKRQETTKVSLQATDVPSRRQSVKKDADQK